MLNNFDWWYLWSNVQFPSKPVLDNTAVVNDL